jgi:hypothetical protein
VTRRSYFSALADEIRLLVGLLAILAVAGWLGWLLEGAP